MQKCQAHFDENMEKIIEYNLVNQKNLDSSLMALSSRFILFSLKDLKSRTKNFILQNIKRPDDELLFALILKNLSDRQISLEKKLINYIISRIDRSYRKIDEFIYKIDELSLKKKKSINFKIIKEIINWVNIGHTLAEN